MKKLLLTFIVGITLTACTTSKSYIVPTLSPEDCIEEDCKYMKETYGDDYRWYEASAILCDYLDAENTDGTIAELTNIFMIRADKDSYDTNIIMFIHTTEGTVTQIIPSHWVEEDVFIIPERVRITFNRAWKTALKATPILHTKHVVLRKQLGPNDTAPQYIFGNNHGLVFIDAFSCQLNYESPAFERTGFETWRGTWPE